MSRNRMSPGRVPRCVLSLTASLLTSVVLAIEPAVPSAPETLELTAEQAQQRLDLRHRQAEVESRSRRDGSAANPPGAARLREHNTVDRLRQQARHEEQRYESGLRRPGILPDAGDAGAPHRQ